MGSDLLSTTTSRPGFSDSPPLLQGDDSDGGSHGVPPSPRGFSRGVFTRGTAQGGVMRVSLLIFLLWWTMSSLSLRLPRWVSLYKDGYYTTNVDHKTMVVYSMTDLEMVDLRQQGMFQEFFHVMGAIKWGQAHGASAVRVFLDNRMYSNRSGDSYWGYFFEDVIPLTPGLSREAVPKDEVHFNDCCGRFGMLGSFTTQAIGDRGNAPFPLLVPPCNEDCGMVRLGGLVREHIHVKPFLREIVDGYAGKHFAGKYVICVQYRGTDKKVLHAKIGMGSYDQFTHLIKRVVANVPPEYGENYVIFVASDEVNAVEHFKKEFGSKVIYLADTPRLDTRDASASGGAHKSLKFTPWQKAMGALIDMLLLAKAHYLIRNRSTVSSVSLLFGEPNVNHTMVAQTDEVLHFTGDTKVAEGMDYPLYPHERLPKGGR
eukprot:TRINITY_DN7102_c0_g1_i4.p1 TRINITY_DN7102_c0_g1~~TRINITY_DN7102_c0_g1_i4.p1  ORF type:complete len:428 (+),score=120.53 TRINITY_DN7102_c0_g1_i4:62-1345(+)